MKAIAILLHIYFQRNIGDVARLKRQVTTTLRFSRLLLFSMLLKIQYQMAL